MVDHVFLKYRKNGKRYVDAFVYDVENTDRDRQIEAFVSFLSNGEGAEYIREATLTEYLAHSFTQNTRINKN